MAYSYAFNMKNRRHASFLIFLKVSALLCLAAVMTYHVPPVSAAEVDERSKASGSQSRAHFSRSSRPAKKKSAAPSASTETKKENISSRSENAAEVPVQNVRYGENVLEVSWMTASMWGIGNPNHYFYMPQIASIHWQLDDVGNPGWRRGNTEWVTSFFVSPIIEGPESRMLGFAMGPRYNFVQPGAHFVPYIESQVGLLWVDSVDPEDHPAAQGQDFCFTFMVGCGVRYDFSDRFSASAGVCYQHVSNGGLSEPEHRNTGLDAVGPSLSVLYKF